MNKKSSLRSERPAEAWLSPPATIEKLKGHVSVIWHVIRLLAKWTIAVPEIEIKIMLAKHLHEDMEITRRCIERLASLGVEHSRQIVETESPSNELRKASVTEGSARKLFAMYRVIKRNLRDQVLIHADQTHPTWDAPTVKVLMDYADELENQISQADELNSTLYPIFTESFPPLLSDVVYDSTGDSAGQFDLTLPDVPARDARFDQCVELINLPEQPDSDQAVLALLHANLMGVEITTIEACSRMILEFPEMPWEFVSDMARQGADEARHAISFKNRLIELGGRLGQFPITHRLWNMASGQDLVVRLGLHQVIGEWTGVDGALWHSQKFIIQGDSLTSQIFAFVALDEITHVGFGNRWIKYLAGDKEGFAEVLRRSRGRRIQFGDPPEAKPAFPFNRWACELAQFPSEVIDEFETNFTRSGSRFSNLTENN